jgi:UDPglucose 6-dehydrogenase
MPKSPISIAGTGYVGLSTAVGFASRGYRVTTSTHDEEKAAKINRGIPPFYEPGLEKLLKHTVKNQKLECILSSAEAVARTDITFVATGTPSRQDGSIDLKYIEVSAREIGEALKKKESYHLVVIKSTVIPGTTENLVKPTIEKYSGKKCCVDFGLCMSPEFLRQGSSLHDTLNPDRIVIGGQDQRSGDVLEALYREFHGEKTPPIIRTNPSSAELIKYASNGLLATKISFMNTIANMCEKIPGADVKKVAAAVGLDKRIGPEFLNAGVGYGGSCFPKDVKAIIAFSKRMRYEPELLEAVERVNDTQPQKAVQLCKNLLGDLKGKKIAVLGLSFKSNTDDMREARSIPIINQLLEEGAKIKAYDPAAIENAKVIFNRKIVYASSVVDCLKGADCCILVTEWEQFTKLKPKDFIGNMKQPILVDGRRIYDPEEFSRKIKFAAIGFGR